MFPLPCRWGLPSACSVAARELHAGASLGGLAGAAPSTFPIGHCTAMTPTSFPLPPASLQLSSLSTSVFLTVSVGTAPPSEFALPLTDEHSLCSPSWSTPMPCRREHMVQTAPISRACCFPSVALSELLTCCLDWKGWKGAVASVLVWHVACACLASSVLVWRVACACLACGVCLSGV